jgi:hypothetical protein
MKLKEEILKEFSLTSLKVEFRSLDLQSETAFLLNLRTVLRNVVLARPALAPILRQCQFSLAEKERTSTYSYELPWNFPVADLQAKMIAAFSN